MRISITRPAAGNVDGVSLDHFQPGLSYDISSSLGTFLIVMGCALPESSDGPGFETSVDEVQFAVNVNERASVAEDRDDGHPSRPRPPAKAQFAFPNRGKRRAAKAQR